MCICWTIKCFKNCLYYRQCFREGKYCNKQYTRENNWLTQEVESFFKSRKVLGQSNIFPQFTKPKALSLSSKYPATCPLPEQDQSSPRPPSLAHFLKIHLNILPSKPRSSRCSLYLGFPPPRPCMHLSPICATSTAHLFPLDLIIRIIFGECKTCISFEN